VTPNVKVPTDVLVPLKLPLLPRVIPAGSEPLVMAKLYGGVPPEAASDAVYAVVLVKSVGKVCGAKTSGLSGTETAKVSVPLVALFRGVLLSTS
jgi:hypothetical protein